MSSKRKQFDDEKDFDRKPRSPRPEKGKVTKHRKRLTVVDVDALDDEEFDELYDYSRGYTR